MIEYTQGVCQDGAAILENGVMLTIEEVLQRLNELSKLKDYSSTNQKLEFKGKMFNGDMDLGKVKMACVPSKPHYAAVDLCLAEGPNSWNIVVAEISNDCLSFEEKKKLGYEMERRWNGVQ